MLHAPAILAPLVSALLACVALAGESRFSQDCDADTVSLLQRQSVSVRSISGIASAKKTHGLAPRAGDIPLWPDGPEGSDGPFLRPILAGAGARGAVIIVPGGAYHALNSLEMDNLAPAVNAVGLHAFVLTYRIADPSQRGPLAPKPLADLARAVRIVRSGGGQAWSVLTNKVAVMGFSAGGHLAAWVGGAHGWQAIEDEDDLAPSVSSLPDAAVLGYPVISTTPLLHSPTSLRIETGDVKSFLNLEGESYSAADFSAPRYQNLSAELLVHAATPPTFIWHCTGDTIVPDEHSRLYAQALAAQGIRHELLIIPGFEHAVAPLSLAEPTLRIWWQRAFQFLAGLGFPLN